MKRLLNGYIETFYVLGDKDKNGFLNHTNSKTLITDPIKARKFENSKDALDYFIQNKINFDEELFAHQIRVTVELI